MIRCAIVGCGNIAGILDTPEDSRILTHAHAIAVHPKTNLIACCDPDRSQLKTFQERWGKSITPYLLVKEMLEYEAINLLIICSPTPFHAKALKQALDHTAIHTIICEKPFVETQKDMDEIFPMIESSTKRIIINFMRRFDPSIQKISSFIADGELGKLLHFNGTFTKGLYHNGSHMLELIEHLCGPIVHLNGLDYNSIDNDFFGSFFLKTTKCSGTIDNTSGEFFSLFELNITLSKGRIRILDLGHKIVIETPVPSQRYNGYQHLNIYQTLPDTMTHYALHTLEYALNNDTQTIFIDHLKLSKKLLAIKTLLPTHPILDWSSHV